MNEALKMNSISIDFGTTNTQVAYLSANGEPRILRIGGEENIPSVLYFKANENKLLVGKLAIRTYEKDLAAAQRAFKDNQISGIEYKSRVDTIHQCLRQQFKTDLFAQRDLKYCYTPTPERDITWVEAFAAIFAFCKENAEKNAFAGESVKAVYLTHPACFSDELKSLYAQAAQAAGFTEVSFIAEPVAAYMAYERMKTANMQQHDNVLVFDMGGGTLDIVTVSRKNDGSFVLRGEWRLANQNGDDAGGACIDHALYDEFINAIRSDLDNENFNADARFITYVRKQVKEYLGEGTASCCPVSYTFLGDVNYTFECEYKYGYLEYLVNKEMRPVYTAIQQNIENAQVKPTLILMVGGSSKLKPIQDKLKSLFSDGENCVKVFSPADADYLVAKGAILLSCFQGGMGSLVSEVNEYDVRWLLSVAELGNIDAQFTLGVCYANSRGVKKDYLTAVKWYNKAAERGHAGAMNNLAVCYMEGHGVSQSWSNAVKWLRKSALKGCREALYQLGACYEDGYGVEQNWDTATKYYLEAAEKNDPDAQFRLGWCYANGKGVLENKKEAVVWLQKSANQGCVFGQYYLAKMYASGDGVIQSWLIAVDLFQKAAEQNFAMAQYHLGLCYFSGEGVLMDKSIAFKWFAKAAEQENKLALNAMAMCYLNGEGVQMDRVTAVKCLIKASEQGLAEAQYNLGFCYENGMGIPRNAAEAEVWYGKAAKQGFEPAVKKWKNYRKEI